MIFSISGDIKAITQGYLVLPTNNLGIANSAPVTDVQNCFTSWFTSYQSMCEQQRPFNACHVFGIAEKLFIANLYCVTSTKPFNRKLDLNALESCLRVLHDEAFHYALPVYALGESWWSRYGMDWEVEVLPIFERIFSETTVQLYFIDQVEG